MLMVQRGQLIDEWVTPCSVVAVIDRRRALKVVVGDEADDGD